MLVPATASRVHFLEKVVEKIGITTGLGLYVGAFWYACGGEVSRYFGLAGMKANGFGWL